MAEGTADTVHGGIVQGMIVFEYAVGAEQGDIAALNLGYFVVRHRCMTLGTFVIDHAGQVRVALQFSDYLRLPERILGRVCHHRSTPVPDNGNVFAGCVSQSIMTHGAVAGAGEMRGVETGVFSESVKRKQKKK